LARRVSSTSSEFVNVIASLMDAIIVYKWPLQATSLHFSGNRVYRDLTERCCEPRMYLPVITEFVG
jgi:hypothetical protein